MQIADVLVDVIRERGPMTVAAFMDLALYHPELGYYARAPQRSGRAGDFFTSVDVGPLFGELVEIQLAEMASILDSQFHSHHFDVVEAGAGNARLSADILRAAQQVHPSFYDRIRLSLVEASPAARAAQHQTLGDMADRLVSSSADLPESFEGTLLANELLDALPVHRVVMRPEGLREVYVDVERTRSHVSTRDRDEGHRTRFVTREGPLSTPALAEYLERLGVTLELGWQVEINLRATDWIRDVAARLRRGFVLVIDYGDSARELYSPTHAAGTLTTFARHTMSGPESLPGSPRWLQRPGEQDMTAHVDFTSVQAAAEAAGLTTLGLLDQTYFVLALWGQVSERGSAETRPLERRLALKTLLMPGGLGSTHKVLMCGNGVGTPALLGCSYRTRVT